MKYYINKHDETGLYWSILLNCRAHANIHIVVIRCILTAALSAFTLLSVFVVFISLLRGKRAAYIYIFIQTNNAQQLQFFIVDVVDNID